MSTQSEILERPVDYRSVKKKFLNPHLTRSTIHSAFSINV